MASKLNNLKRIVENTVKQLTYNKLQKQGIISEGVIVCCTPSAWNLNCCKHANLQIGNCPCQGENDEITWNTQWHPECCFDHGVKTKGGGISFPMGGPGNFKTGGTRGRDKTTWGTFYEKKEVKEGGCGCKK